VTESYFQIAEEELHTRVVAEMGGDRRHRYVWCSVLQCVAVCCSVLQCVAVWLLRWEQDEEERKIDDTGTCGAVWCSVLQCGAVCCSVLQCVAVWLLRWEEDEEEGETDDTGTCGAV